MSWTDDFLYVLKFGAAWVLPPGIFLLLFFYIAWRSLRQAKRRLAAFLGGATAALYLLSTAWASSALIRPLEHQYEPPANPTGDVIVTLGGGAWIDVTDVDGLGVLCASPANRLLAAVRLHKKLKLPILLSGGQVYADSGNEAEIAGRVLLSLGVAARDIIIENRSLNTGQNARYSAAIIRERGFTRPILVTSAYHMPRAVLNFAKNGVEVTPFPTDYWAAKLPQFHFNSLRPTAEAFYTSATALQERLRYLVTKYLE